MRVISKKLRDSARGQCCTLRISGVCNFNSETTVLAHLPCGHKGVGMKGPDVLAIFCCAACHQVLDGPDRWTISAPDFLRALAETQMYWISKGLIKVEGMKRE